MAPPVVDAARAEVPLRLLSAAVLAPAALAATYAGGVYFAAMIAAFALVLAWEWARVTGEGRTAVLLWAAVAAAIGVGLAFGLEAGMAAALGGALIVSAALGLAGEARPGWGGAGVAYIVVPAVALIWLRQDPHWARAGTFWLLGIVWASDIGGYVAGSAIRGPLLAPKVSPNKTWAGCIGGLIASGLVSIVAAKLAAPGQLGFFIAFGAILSIAAQLGDLMESAIKRHFGIKDMSQIIPGHGGVFDRVDGLLAAAPVAAMAVRSGVFLPWQ